MRRAVASPAPTTSSVSVSALEIWDASLNKKVQTLASGSTIVLQRKQCPTAWRWGTVLTSSPIPGDAQAAVLREIIPILVSEQQVKPGTDVAASLKALFAPQFIQAVAQK